MQPEANGRWRVLAQALIGVLLGAILTVLLLLYHRLDGMQQEIAKLSEAQSSSKATREAEAISSARERVETYRRIEILEKIK